VFNIKMTSDQWCKRHNIVLGLEILDPDGWNRKDFEFSFYKEKITEKEFSRRLACSTCNVRMLDEKGVG